MSIADVLQDKGSQVAKVGTTDSVNSAVPS